MSSPQELLENVFGYEQFRPQQLAIIDSVIRGEDNFVLMPTGGGKSLCYQIPALIRQGTAIVISPLIALMQDQVQALCSNNVNAAFYNSSQSGQQARETLARLHAGELDLLYIAPERLLANNFLQRFDDLDIALFAIDEAHCVSQWGHEFRPEYVQLGCLAQEFPDVPIIALTATADKQTRHDIIHQLKLRQAHTHISSFDRPNIRYTVLEKHKPFEQVLSFLKNKPDQAGIIYCSSRKRVEEVAEKLCQRGFNAKPYHAGLSGKLRQQTQQAFLNDDVTIIVATIAFGMGIDKSNVRFVVHYDLPKHIEAYYQETGRAGRDGLNSEALLLFGLGDIAIIKNFINQLENLQLKRIEQHKLQAMIAFADGATCRRRILLNYFGESLEQACGNCDNCLNPPETYDGLIDAQKVLSTIYRLKQRFGVHYVVSVLRGMDNQKIKQYGHEQLSVYGIGKEHSEHYWYSIIRQLIHRGVCEQDIANYSILYLTDKARPLLRGEQSLALAKPRVRVQKTKQTKKAKTELPTDDQALFNLLRDVRKHIASERAVPPYIIFSDAALTEMAVYKPQNPSHFLQINGVGEHKLKQYGEQFITVIADYMNALA